MTELRDLLKLDLHERGPKPRTRGLTHVIGSDGHPMSYLEDYLEEFGPYIDSFKLYIGQLFEPADRTRKKIEMLVSHGISVQPSGTYVEIARARGNEREVLEAMRELGVTTAEVSASTGTARAMEEQVASVQLAREIGFKVVGEVGAKWPDGDTTRRAPDEINVEETIRQMQAYLDAGVEKFYWEGQILRLVMGQTPAEMVKRRESALAQVLPVVEAIGQDHIIFETTLLPDAQRRLMYLWFIRFFGPEVNLGNVQLEDVGFLEGMRRGIAPAEGMGRAGAFPWIRSAAANGGTPAERWWDTPD